MYRVLFTNNLLCSIPASGLVGGIGGHAYEAHTPQTLLAYSLTDITIIKRFFVHTARSIKSDGLYLGLLEHMFCQTIQNYLDLCFYKRNFLLIKRLSRAIPHICIWIHRSSFISNPNKENEPEAKIAQCQKHPNTNK